MYTYRTTPHVTDAGNIQQQQQQQQMKLMMMRLATTATMPLTDGVAMQNQ